MMTLKLNPGAVTALPLTAYYSITFVKLFVGESGIESCILRIGNRNILFAKGSNPEHGVLTVNGDPYNTPTHILMPRTENNILMTLPQDASSYTPKPEILLYYDLSYHVPKTHPEFSSYWGNQVAF